MQTDRCGTGMARMLLRLRMSVASTSDQLLWLVVHQTFTPESIENHRKVLLDNADLGVGDAAGLSPGECSLTRQSTAPCHANPYIFVPTPGGPLLRLCSTAAAGLLFHDPFDTSFEAGLQELEMTTHKAVQGALDATGLQATEVGLAARMHAPSMLFLIPQGMMETSCEP